MQLHAIAEGVYEVTSEFNIGPGMRLPVRATLLALASGDLVLVSPVAFDEDTQRAIDAKGRVAHIVAPNTFHHLFLKGAMERWPSAKVHGARGLAKKRPDLVMHAVFGDDRFPFGADVECVLVGGMPSFNEVVLFHCASRTLVVTDLIFNFGGSANARGFLAPLALTVFGTRGRLAQSRLFLSAVKDREAFVKSGREIMALDFDRLVVAHGETIDAGAKPRVEQALYRMLS
ncbi:MAG: DUF4336 domain-containing protein [Polyangiaceae bacterium]